MKLPNGTKQDHKAKEDVIILPDTKVSVTLIRSVNHNDNLKEVVSRSHQHSKELCGFARSTEQNLKIESLKKLERVNEEKREYQSVIERYQKIQKVQNEIIACSNRQVNKTQGNIEERKGKLTVLRKKLQTFLKDREELETSVQNLLNNEMILLIRNHITAETTDKIYQTLSSQAKDPKLIAVIDSAISLIKTGKEIDYITVNVRCALIGIELFNAP